MKLNVVLLVLACTIAPMLALGSGLWADALPITVFSDDFSDGTADCWVPGPNSVWQVVGGEYQAAPTTGSQDGSIIDGITLPAVFSYDLDFGFRSGGTYYSGGALFSSTAAGGGFGGKWLAVGIYTHNNFPNDIKATIYTSDGGYWETAATPKAGAVCYHLKAERPPGAYYINLEATGAASPLTIQTPTILWLDELKYAGLFVAGGSGWNGYDNVSLTTVQEPDPMPNEELMAEYQFGEMTGSVALDGSGNGNTGLIAGGTWSDAGFLGSCLEFDGSGNYVEVSDCHTLDLISRMTLEAWVCPESLPQGGEWRIIDKCENVDAYMLAVGPDYVRGGFASDENPQNYYYAESTGALPINRWTHLAVTFDGVQVKLYIDGQQAAICNAPGKSIRVTADKLFIASGFVGRMDQVRIYGRDKTRDEIAQTVVRAHYRFNEGTSTLAEDDSGYGNDCGILNASWVAQSHQAFEGSCLSFGSAMNDVSAADSESLDLAGEFTLSAWVNPSSLPLSGEWRIIDKRDIADAYLLAVGPDYVRGGFASDEAPQQYYCAVGYGALPINRWTHLAVTYDGAEVKVYVNGVERDVASASGKRVKVTSGWLRLCKDFRGKLDDVRIIGRVLSAYEIRAERLAGFWGFEEGLGTSAADYSHNSNAATLENGAMWSSSGVRGNCLSFDGIDDCVSVLSNGSLQPIDAITVEAWINPDTLGANWSYVVAKQSYWLAVKNGAVKSGFLAADLTPREATASVTIPTGGWSHVAMTYDGSFIRLFLNGVKKATYLVPGYRIAATDDTLYIGSRGSGLDSFDGRCDEVCVIDTAKDYNIAGMLSSVGKTARLDYGSYPVASTIYFRSNQVLEGRGPDRTLLRLNDNVNHPLIMTYHYDEKIYWTTADHDIVVRDLSIEGNSANNLGGGADVYYPMGITLSNTYNFTIERVYVRDVRGYAGIIIWPNHYTYEDGVTSIDNYILHCLVTGSVNPESNGIYGTGIYVTGFDQRNTIIGRNTCRNNAGTGIFLEDGQSYMDVVHNICANNGSSGIWINISDHINVLYNTVENNAARGILLDGGAGFGAYAGTVYNLISRNSILYNGWEGIYQADSDRGPYDAYCTFSDNTIENNNAGQHVGINGITVRNVRRVTMDRNTCRDTRPVKWQYYGIATEGTADYATVTYNNLNYNRLGDISLVGSNNIVDYDTILPLSGTASSPPSATGECIPVNYSGAYDTPSGIKSVELWYKKEWGGQWICSGVVSPVPCGVFNFVPPNGTGIYYFGLVAEDCAGNRSAVPTGAGDTQVVYSDITPTTIADVKSSADGTEVSAIGVVTANFGDYFYIEAADRSIGIRVAKATHGASVNETVQVTGTIGTLDSGERVINAFSVVDLGVPATLQPLGASNKNLGGDAFGGQVGVYGGVGLNNVGLLMKTTGRVSNSSGSLFSIDDGSGVSVDAMVMPGMGIPSDGSYVGIVGAVSCKRSNEGSIERLILVTNISIY